MRICCFFVTVGWSVGVGLFGGTFASIAQESSSESTAVLTTEQQNALEEVTESDVKATISFLACDELQGRATASQGFQIASAYVASRFQAAGLEGGAESQTFFQETTVPTVRCPTVGIVLLDRDGNPIEHYGLLAASDTRIQFAGEFKSVDLDNIGDEVLDAVVMADWNSSSKDLKAHIELVRACNKLQSKQAKGLILFVEPDHDLLRRAEFARAELRIEDNRLRVGVPILLAPKTAREKIAQVDFPKKIDVQSKVRNVIGVLKGSDAELSKQAIIFSAHLDHLGARPDSGDGIFNGADDDASGVTAVLELADAFASMKTKPKRTVIFMTFWGEESGLLGSKHYAANPLWPHSQTVANINIEMIGRPEEGAHEKIWMTGWNESDLGTLMQTAASKHGKVVFEHPRFSSMLYRASDNASFVDAGVVAHSFSAGSLHSDYHQPSDEWQKLDLTHMTRVIHSLYLASLPISEGEITPRRTPR
jgi:Peptidase family M28